MDELLNDRRSSLENTVINRSRISSNSQQLLAQLLIVDPDSSGQWRLVLIVKTVDVSSVLDQEEGNLLTSDVS